MRVRILRWAALGLWVLGGVSLGWAEERGPAEDSRGLWRTFSDSTHLIELKQGSELSRKVSSLQTGGFESAQGAWVSMQPWYGSRWTDSTIAWMTQLNPGLGVIWGLGTGERGDKYRIDPSLKVGFIVQTEPRKQHYLSFKATARLGGRLREKPCTADYGEIGGVQQVNCRLAASTLAPSETLNYLLNERPQDRMTWMLQYKFFF